MLTATAASIHYGKVKIMNVNVDIITYQFMSNNLKVIDDKRHRFFIPIAINLRLFLSNQFHK